MKIPEFLKMEYMGWRGKAMVVAGFVMLIALIFILGLWEGYKIGIPKMDACKLALDTCRTMCSQLIK